MAFLKQTLTLSTVGASLITSNSFWFFDFFGIHPIQNVSVAKQMEVPTSNPLPSIQPSQKKSTPNINRFKTALKHADITGKTLTNGKLKLGSPFLNFGFNFTLEDQAENKDKYMSRITSQTMEDFTLTFFEATEDQYKNFPKEEIKIRLFKNPAWYSSTNEDEYSSKLEETQINKLFEGQDEAKVKQLLLSLNKGLNWKKFDYDKSEKRTKYISELFYSSKLNDLKDLKIKYFKNFEDLKNYVHKKVTTCTGEEIACIANYEELDIMDTDKPSFFDGLEKT